jgi:hypothetical protein
MLWRLGLCLLFPTLAAGETLWSEDFEQGPPYAFDVGPNSAIDPEEAWNGACSIRLTCPGGSTVTVLSQSITVTPGETYILRWGCRTQATGKVTASVSVRFAARSMSLESSVQSGTTAWRKHASVFTPAAGETSVQLRLACSGDAGNQAWFDTFELTHEPGYLDRPHVVTQGAAVLRTGGPLEVWYAYPFRKLYPYTQLEPDPCMQADGSIRIQAAANESESFMLALRLASEALSLAFDASGLTGPSSGLDASAVSFKRIVNTQVNSPGLQSVTARFPEEPDPCPTLPKGVAVSFAPNELRSVLTTIQVPAGTPAGIYQGTIRITGDVSTDIPLELEVFEFALPDEPAVISSMGFAVERMRQRWPDPQPTSEEVREAFLQLLAASDQHPNRSLADQLEDAHWVSLQPDYTVSIDFALFDQLVADGLTRGFPRFTLPPINLRVRPAGQPAYLRPWLGLTPLTPEFNMAFGDYCCQLEAHLTAQGWANLCSFYLWDEPSSDEIAGPGQRPLDRQCRCRGLDAGAGAVRLRADLGHQPSQPGVRADRGPADSRSAGAG